MFERPISRGNGELAGNPGQGGFTTRLRPSPKGFVLARTTRFAMMQTDIHTSAQACGKIFGELKPCHAVTYHFFNEEGTRYGLCEAFQGFREKLNLE